MFHAVFDATAWLMGKGNWPLKMLQIFPQRFRVCQSAKCIVAKRLIGLDVVSGGEWAWLRIDVLDGVVIVKGEEQFWG